MLKRCHSWVLKQKKTGLCSATLFEHKTLGTKFVHIESSDTQKAFATLIRTPPSSNNGVFQVLERLIMCGSKNYPVRDPISKMSSISSYRSSWSGSDFTMFPFCTSDEKDFENLLSVYLDCIFAPLLSYQDFLKEAWRFDSSQELQLTGSLYEELKLRHQNPDEVLLARVLKELYPGTCYEYYPSPLDLAKTTHLEVVSSHQEFYHPSNSTFFLYSNRDPLKIAEMIEFAHLSRYKKIEKDSRVAGSKLKPNKDQVYVKTSGESKFVRSYLCDNIEKDYFTNFCLNVLSTVLFDGPDAVLKKHLIDTGLCHSFLPWTGYDETTREASFSFAFNTFSPDDDKKIELGVRRALTLAIPSELIESALHQIEIQYKEIKENYSLQLFSSMIPYAIHTNNPLAPVSIPQQVKQLRTLLAQDEPIFQNLIQRYLIENKYFAQVIASPDSEVSRKIQREEFEFLSSFQLLMTDESQEEIERQSKELVAERIENIEVLPSLTPEDLNTSQEPFKYESEAVISGLKVKYIIGPTNGLTYIRIKCNILNLPFYLRGLLPMYRTLFNNLGTKKKTFIDLNKQKQLYTVSGVTTSYHSSASKYSINDLQEHFIYKIAFLDRNIDQAFEILEDTLTQISFDDTEHLTNLMQQDVKNRTDEIKEKASVFAEGLAQSSLTPAGNSYEPLGVLKHDTHLAAQMISSLSNLNKIYKDVSSRLSEIHSYILNKDDIEVLVHTSSKDLKELINERLELLENSLRLHCPSFLNPRVLLVFGKERARVEFGGALNMILDTPEFNPFIYQLFFTLPIEKNCVVEAFRACGFSNSDFSVLQVICEILNEGILRKEFDSNCTALAQVDWEKGSFVLSTRQDLNHLRTFNSFERCVSALAEGKFSDKELELAKLQVFSKLHKPKAAYNRGMDLFLNGFEGHLKGKHRENLVGVTRADVLKVSQKYLLSCIEKGQTSKVIFGSEQVNRKELQDAGWIVQSPIEIISNK